jgi:hypothetical protein
MTNELQEALEFLASRIQNLKDRIVLLEKQIELQQEQIKLLFSIKLKQEVNQK